MLWESERDFLQWVVYLSIVIAAPILLIGVLKCLYDDYKSGTSPWRN